MLQCGFVRANFSLAIELSVASPFRERLPRDQANLA
jgi:hypothetical protein